MRTQQLGTSDLQVPLIAVGCMRITELDTAGVDAFLGAAMDAGATFFDHADVYGQGSCEEIFGQALRRTAIDRDRVVLQSKCGIRPGVAFDFSYEHIVASVNGSLQRLQTDHLDVLLLHRPDALVEPDEVARAFDELVDAGKVRHVGVSNQNPMQMELLRRSVRQPIVANQLQLSIPYAPMITAGTHVNMAVDAAVNRDGSVLDYCRLHDITVQPWSPFQFGFFEGVFLGHPDYPELNAVLDEVAADHGVTPTTIAIAWLLRHPARMQPVTGTTNAQRLAECAAAADVTLSREDWYRIYLAAGHTLP
jgi:predicted oxidoreductase